VRLRFQLPRRGRRAGLGGLAAALLLASCGGGEERKKPAPRPAPEPAPAPRFAIGIDERNPALLSPGKVPARFEKFRDALAELKPTYVRVLIDWSAVQPSADRPPDFAALKDGCARGIPPCAPYHGIRDTLRAVVALGAEPIPLIYGTPEWAAQPPAGCEREGITNYNRVPRIEPYRALVRGIKELFAAEKIELLHLSPWNEPNTPIFLNPQRARCSAGSRSLAVGRYAQLAQAASEEIGVGRLLLGETAGIDAHTHATGAAELAAGLPDELVCGAAAWAQHAYVPAPRDGGKRLDPVPLAHNAGVVSGVERALDEHHCDHEVPVWITETGAGDRPGACPAMAAQLRAWQRDPRIRAAFQYTLRDDPIFPVGLADAKLTKLYPTFEAWRTRNRCG